MILLGAGWDAGTLIQVRCSLFPLTPALSRRERGKRCRLENLHHNEEEMIMGTATIEAPKTAATTSAWDGFNKGLWQKSINVRDFIQQNYAPYEGDGRFLAPATERTAPPWSSNFRRPVRAVTSQLR